MVILLKQSYKSISVGKTQVYKRLINEEVYKIPSASIKDLIRITFVLTTALFASLNGVYGVCYLQMTKKTN